MDPCLAQSSFVPDHFDMRHKLAEVDEQLASNLNITRFAPDQQQQKTNEIALSHYQIGIIPSKLFQKP